MAGRVDRPRGSAASRGYDARWRRYRKDYLWRHPLCVMCRQRDMITAATVVDHIEPHKGDPVKFWDDANHQALCVECHNSTKQAQEKSGHLRGSDADGMPLDPNHPWNRK